MKKIITSIALLAAITACSPAQAEEGYEWATNSRIIGMNPDYVEKVLGPPMYKHDGNWTYDFNGCEVTYIFDGATIDTLTAVIKENCQPVINGKRLTPATTFADVGIDNGMIQADCIFSCGNAADPTIDLFFQGYRANGGIEIIYRGNYSDAQSAAMDLWVDSIRRERGIAPDDFTYREGVFDCVSSPPAGVNALLRNETITAVTLGADVNTYCN